MYDASGAITLGGTAQLLLPDHGWCGRSHFFFQNISVVNMYVDFGAARATATITSGVVTGTTITNAGFNYSKPPIVRFEGGGNGPNSSYIGLAAPGGLSPSNVATGVAVMTGTAPNLSVASITLTHPGSGYVQAPFVFLFNSDLDPYGAALPSATEAGGISVGPQGTIYYNGTVCPTDPVAVFCATTSAAFTCKFMT